MRKPRSAFVLLLLLGFSVPLAIPAEDAPETAYDESESLPYEVIPLVYAEVSQSAPAHQPVRTGLNNSVSAPGHTSCLAGRTDLAPYLVAGSLTILDLSLRC